MASSVEESVEEIFEKTIKIAFGKDSWKDKELLNKYNKVIKKRDEILNNGKAEDGCGEYGDNPTTIELMLYVRKLMREEKLIPDVPLKFYIQSEPVTIKETINNFNNFIENDGKNTSWLTKEYKKRFPKSYGSEPESHLSEYDIDGWDYSEYQKRNPLDADIEWLFKYRAKIGHIYYNELDHYLTYLVGAILVGAKRRYKTKINYTPDRIRQGDHIKEDLKRMSEKDF